MTIETLTDLFETSSLLTIIGTIFLINLALTMGEVILDLLTHKERRWKDTAANCAIFVVGQVLEDTVFASIGLVLVAQYQHWVHAERVHKLGWLDEVFNTPSVHHGSNRKYLGKNYGGILILWDKLFGTFQREEDTVTYGLTQTSACSPIKTTDRVPSTPDLAVAANAIRMRQSCASEMSRSQRTIPDCVSGLWRCGMR